MPRDQLIVLIVLIALISAMRDVVMNAMKPLRAG
jgi:hypothetical protein